MLDILDGHIGALSEQNIEHVHSKVNNIALKSFNIANQAERAKYIMKVIFFVRGGNVYILPQYTSNLVDMASPLLLKILNLEFLCRSLIP